jgi:hypothetical protein
LSQWKVFAAAKLFVSADLTPLEQQRRSEIIKVMKDYWNVDRIKQSQFVRDCLKCSIDNSDRFCVLTYE